VFLRAYANPIQLRYRGVNHGGFSAFMPPLIGILLGWAQRTNMRRHRHHRLVDAGGHFMPSIPAGRRFKSVG